MEHGKQPYEALYPHLFAPLKIGKNTFKNRVFVSPTHLPFGAGLNNLFTNEGMRHFSQFAKGGAAAIHIGETLLDRKNSMAHDSHVNIIDEECLKNFHTYNEYCHIFNTISSIEFNHSGHFSIPEIGDGSQPMSASAQRMPNGVEVREMNEDDMEYVAQTYAKAANMAKRGGFDMILLHFAHGWLMGGFLSPILNHRKDKYGGSVENRMRFPLMVLERVRKTVGKDFLIEMRLSGEEMAADGITIDEAVEYVKMIQDYASLAHISTGSRIIPVSRALMHPTHFIEEGHNAHLAAYVKKAGVTIPIGTLGGFGRPETAEKVLAEGMADYVLMARGFIAEPNWVNKARCGKAEDIRPCIRCLRCLDIPLGKRNTSTHNLMDILDEFPKTTRRAECSVNPFHGNGHCRRDFPTSDEKKRVVIVGGGPAGMNAALSAKKRGHDVTLFEAGNVLGGQLYYAKHVWFKEDMERYRAYLENQVKKAGVTLRLGVRATAKLVRQEMPDALILALGASPIIPKITGVALPHVVTCMNLFGNEGQLGKRVAVIGGGMVGCETALHLSRLGHIVDLVEAIDILALDGTYTERLHTLHFIEEDPSITVHCDTKCIEIKKEGILVQKENQEPCFFEADSVALCVGMKARTEELGEFENIAFDTIVIGDCKKVSSIAFATASGYDAGLVL